MTKCKFEREEAEISIGFGYSQACPHAGLLWSFIHSGWTHLRPLAVEVLLSVEY